ncbi:MAG: histidine phosphatase family protein [Ruminococcus sp.]|nr:histidine phosphatase family protein [Ruminococcus sp.]
MKILIIRHADPDYENDSITEKGKKEAELLSQRIAPMNISEYYVSPLGRARKTAGYTLEKCGKTAVTLDWLHEFDRNLIIGNNGERRIAWDMLPENWTSVPEYYDKDKWTQVPVMAEADIQGGIAYVNDGLDDFLSNHGYERYNNYYLAKRPNSDTIVFFCHFGVECVIIGHLLGISPMILWHGTMAAPTSVTTIATEERREGKAFFRLLSFGDTSHLYANGESPAFAGRFCEMFTNTDERHD